MSRVNPDGINTAADGLGLETLAIRSGHVRGPEREHAEPIFATSSYVFESAEHAASLFAEEEIGNVYSRFTNPTVATFETRLGYLEGGQYCIGTSSGLAAITGLMLCRLKAGDHVVASRELFGSTISLFNKIFSRFDISVTLVPVVEETAWQQAIQPNTKMLFLETPTNPLCQIADIRKMAEIAHDVGALLVVDNCFCTPILQQPLAMGADVVVHTATKFLDGQGRCVGGAIVTNDETIHDDYFAMMRTTGPSMSPFNAWVFLKGLETLSLRMTKHCDNARAVAEWLQRQEGIENVFYPGIESHPGHELSKSQQTGFGAVVSFQLEGGRSMSWKFINATRVISITANLGDAKTTITHPASTTHGRLTEQERKESGITEGLIRIAVGLEDVADIIADLERGLIASRVN